MHFSEGRKRSKSSRFAFLLAHSQVRELFPQMVPRGRKEIVRSRTPHPHGLKQTLAMQSPALVMDALPQPAGKVRLARFAPNLQICLLRLKPRAAGASQGRHAAPHSGPKMVTLLQTPPDLDSNRDKTAREPLHIGLWPHPRNTHSLPGECAVNSNPIRGLS